MYVGNPGAPANNIVRCTIVDRSLGTVNSCTSVSTTPAWGLIAGKTDNTFFSTTTSSSSVSGHIINANDGTLTRAGNEIISSQGFAGLVWAP